jgi:lysozyme family protein
MLPLVGIAASLLPDLIRVIAGDKAGTVASDVATAVKTATGSDDPAAAKAALADPKVAADLQVKLAQIALDATKTQNAEADAARTAELESLKSELQDTQDARNVMLQLANKESPVAYGAPVVSIIVALGFFGILGLAFFRPNEMANNNAAFALIGTMATAFATMISFWLGSSQGSRNKDETARQLQLIHTTQTSDLLSRMTPANPGAPQPGPGTSPARVTASTERFLACLQVVFSLEGGFTNDPADRGGPTNLGVTASDIARYRNIKVEDVKEEQIRTLSIEDATNIYRSQYWNVMRCDALAAGVDLMVFHFGVNAGVGMSANVLQRCVGSKQDGSIGQETLRAAAQKDASALIGLLSSAQLEYYHGCAEWDRFGNGWTSRVSQATRAAMQMTKSARATAGA